jgi:hypothetical protein
MTDRLKEKHALWVKLGLRLLMGVSYCDSKGANGGR